MSLATYVAAVRSLIESDPDALGLVDRCELIGPTFVDGGSTGDSVTFGPLESDLECLYEPARQNVQIVVGGDAFIATHRVMMLRTAVSELITPKFRIKVAARADKPEMVFEKPVQIDESLSPLVTVNAVLVKQGYQ